MKNYVAFFFYFLLAIDLSHAQPSNINISNTQVFGGEPYIAVNPTNNQNIIISWMALDVSTGLRMAIKSKVSFDGGTTWGNTFIHPHFGPTWNSADVSMQFRPNGTLYLSYIDYRQAPDSGGVYITHSVNGGVTWSVPVQIWNALTEDPSKRPLDRPWLAVDNSASSNDGMFYLTTKPAPWIAPPNRPYLKTSSDSGQTWSAFRYVDTTNFLVGNSIAGPMGFPTVSADGALCVAYPSYLSSQSIFPKVLLAKSYSKGASFQYYDMLVNSVSVQDTLYKLGYRLAANPSNANQLAFSYLAKPNGDPDVYLITTNDGGITWGAPVRVNDDIIGNGKAQEMAWVDYDNNNKLVVTWRDRRNGTGTGFYQSSDTYCALSTNNGNSFQPNIRLSNVTAPFDSILEQSGNDFLSTCLVNDTIYSAWGDVRTGKLNICFAKTSVSTGTGIGAVAVDDEQELFSVSPNPVKDQLQILFTNRLHKPVELKIINQEGLIVFQKRMITKVPSITIDLSHLPTGSYWVIPILNML